MPIPFALCFFFSHLGNELPDCIFIHGKNSFALNFGYIVHNIAFLYNRLVVYPRKRLKILETKGISLYNGNKKCFGLQVNGWGVPQKQKGRVMLMKLTFIGADHEVTGSCHCIEACGKYILVDYGMEQESMCLKTRNCRWRRHALTMCF